MNTPTRRDFLKLFSLGATGATLSAAGLYIPEPEPVRRYWQVGAQLQSGAGLREGEVRLQDGTVVVLGDVTPYAREQYGDTEKRLRFGRSFGMRDFSEDDRFEPIIFGGKDYADTGLTFETPGADCFKGDALTKSVWDVGSMLSVATLVAIHGLYRDQ